MTQITKPTELVLIGCGDLYKTLSADAEIYIDLKNRLQCFPLSGPSALASQSDELLDTLEPTRHRLFIAVDANAMNHARLELYGRARLRGFRMSTLVHPMAYVSPAATLGDNVWVGPSAQIAADCKLGSNTLVGANARLDNAVTVGNHVWLGAGSSIGSTSHIGNHCIVGNDVKLRSGTRVGKYSFIEQAGPWSGEVAAGTFALNTYAEPARLIGAGYTHSLRASP